MNTKTSLSQTNILPFGSRFSDTRSGFVRRSSLSPTLASKPFYSGQLKAARETTSTEPSNTKSADNEDSFFSKIAINFLSKNLQDTAGMGNCSSKSTGYDSLVDAAPRVATNLDTKQQHELILRSLDRALPTVISSLVKETEVNGEKEKSVVFIKKCRFLEQTYCVGMCTHICKIPSQIFIKNSLGMPIYMKPDFDDLSCEMMFGQEPPEIKDDPVMKQPCFNFCNANKSYGVKH